MCTGRHQPRPHAKILGIALDSLILFWHTSPRRIATSGPNPFVDSAKGLSSHFSVRVPTCLPIWFSNHRLPERVDRMAIIRDDGEPRADTGKLRFARPQENGRANPTGWCLERACIGHALVVTIGLLAFMCLGCASVDLRGQPDPPSELSELAQRARPKDPNLEPFTFSNRARSIESDLGVR